MFIYIYSIFLVVWEIFCCKFLLEAFINKKKNNRKLFFIGFIIIYYLITYIFYEYLWLKQLFIIFILSIAMYLLFDAQYRKIFILTILYQGLVLVADASTILIIGTMFPSFSVEVSQSENVSMLVSIICKMTLLIMILIIKRNIGHKSSDMLTDLEWIRMLIVPLITIISLTAIMLKYDILENMQQDDFLLYVALGMAGMNIVVFYLVNDILQRETIIRNEKLLREKMINETKMYYSVSENLEKQRKITHEFKNQIACILSLAKNQKYKELNDYIEKVDKSLKLSMDMVDTNHVIVNAVLNTKYREAIDAGVVFVLKVNDLSEMKLSDTDIVAILANLLNNALEACMKCENKLIKLKFVLENNQIIISVKNSCSNQPIRNNGKFVTLKDDVEEHGFGIENVVEVIERYDGKYVIDYDEDMFSFFILIPN